MNIFIVNNPISLLFLFSPLFECNEVWLESSLDRPLGQGVIRFVAAYCKLQNISFRVISKPSLFSFVHSSKTNQVFGFRRLSSEVISLCKEHDVNEITCSTTSIFRLAGVRVHKVFDHGLGDYLRPFMNSMLEDAKYKYLYSSLSVHFSASLTRISRYSIIPSKGKTTVSFDSFCLKTILSDIECGWPSSCDSGLILLLSPLLSVADQIQMLLNNLPSFSGRIYLKPHYASLLPCPVVLPCGPRVHCSFLPVQAQDLPVELLTLANPDNIRVASIDSSAIWNLACIQPSSILRAYPKELFLELFKNVSPLRLQRLEAIVGRTPYL